MTEGAAGVREEADERGDVLLYGLPAEYVSSIR
jgi:hypothetical protein